MGLIGLLYRQTVEARVKFKHNELAGYHVVRLRQSCHLLSGVVLGLVVVMIFFN